MPLCASTRASKSARTFPMSERASILSETRSAWRSAKIIMAVLRVGQVATATRQHSSGTNQRLGNKGGIHSQDFQRQIKVEPVQCIARGMDRVIGVVGPFDGQDGRHPLLDERDVIAVEWIERSLHRKPG